MRKKLDQATWCPRWLRAKLASMELVCPSAAQEQETLLAALKACSKSKDLERGKALHWDAVEAGCHTNKYVANALVTMYGKCGSMLNARLVFDNMIRRDAVSWNSLMLGYVENGESLVAFNLFTNMDCEPTCLTFVAAFKALATHNEWGRHLCVEKAMAIHVQAKERGFDSDLLVATTLVDMYSKCGSMFGARHVFDSMSFQTVVSWNSLILGYVQNGESLIALDLFATMEFGRDSVSYVAALKACAQLAAEKQSERQSCLAKGMAIHRQAKESALDIDEFVASNLMNMYCECGSMSHAHDVFDNVVHPDVVSWNILITGYVENGEGLVSMDLLNSMDCESDSLTFVAAVKACASVGAFAAGERVHGQICKLGLEQDQMLTNSLVYFYGKCDSMTKAEHVFNTMDSPGVVSWNALIAGYSTSSDSYQVFSLVKKMEKAGLHMNGTTLLLILTTCSHAGLVEEGRTIFESIRQYYVRPTVEHYHCVIDMLGRANRLQEAMSIAKCMPFEAGSVAWTSLLGACRNLNNPEVSKVAFDALVACNKKDSAPAYVLMTDIK